MWLFWCILLLFLILYVNLLLKGVDVDLQNVF